MSVALPKHVILSLLKRNISHNFFKNSSLRRLHKESRIQTCYNLNTSLLEHFRAKNADVRTIHSVSEDTYESSKDERRELMAIWPDVVRDITDAVGGRNSDIPDVVKWLTKVLQYNVPGGKKIRALSVIHAYKALRRDEHITEDDLHLVRILGWCTELLQAFFLVIDDIQDQSTTRRNQLCWYLNNGIGLSAINDAILVEMSMYQLLKKHFKSKDCYINLLELFLDLELKTSVGQSLDLLLTNFGKKVDLNLFTMDRYNSIVKYKTAYYTFALPACAALHFAGVKDPEMFRQARTILLEMGLLFQVRDDYLDCYGDPEVIGKIGTDIEVGKCSWLVVVALQRATPEQKKILEECYGDSDPEKVSRVKQLYNELGLPNTYAVYEEETFNLLHTHIQQVSRGLPHEFFLKLLNRSCHKVGRKD